MTANPACGDCRKMMSCQKIGIMVVDPVNVRWVHGDLYACPDCGMKAIAKMSRDDGRSPSDGQKRHWEYERFLNRGLEKKGNIYVVDRGTEASVITLRPVHETKESPPTLSALVAFPSRGLKQWKVRTLQSAGWNVEDDHEDGDTVLHTNNPDCRFDTVCVGPIGGIRAWVRASSRGSRSVSLQELVNTSAIRAFLQAAKIDAR